jgi:hypothetical protein
MIRVSRFSIDSPSRIINSTLKVNWYEICIQAGALVPMPVDFCDESS